MLKIRAVGKDWERILRLTSDTDRVLFREMSDPVSDYKRQKYGGQQRALYDGFGILRPSGP